MRRTSMVRFTAPALAWLLAVGPLEAGVTRVRLASAEAVDDRLESAARLRAERIESIREALRLPVTGREAAKLGVRLDRRAERVPTLSDTELADLAKRSKNAKDLVAGHRAGDDDALVVVGVVLLVAGLVILAALADWDDYYDDECWCY